MFGTTTEDVVVRSTSNYVGLQITTKTDKAIKSTVFKCLKQVSVEGNGLAILLRNKIKNINYTNLVRDSPHSLVQVAVLFVLTTSLAHRDFEILCNFLQSTNHRDF